MAGKNTAAFRIFKTRMAAERCVDALIANGFRSDDVSVLAPDVRSTKELATEKTRRLLRGRPRALRPEVRSVERWAFWLALGRLPFQALALSSQPAPLWQRLPALEREPQLGGLWARS
jgi:hypothetical protein